MLKTIFNQATQNIFIVVSAVYLLALIFLGKASAMSILFAYFLETIIIGLFNALKMFWTLKFGMHKKNNAQFAKYGIIIFFLFHYGFFVAIQSIFGFALFGIESTSVIKEPFHIIDNYRIILGLEDITYVLPAILFVHVGKFFLDFIKNKKYDVFTANEIMFKPYVRIFIQQFVVIISFFFIVFGEAGIIAAVLLIIFRLIVDLTLESIKKDSKVLDIMAEKLANERVSKEEAKKQLISFTE